MSGDQRDGGSAESTYAWVSPGAAGRGVTVAAIVLGLGAWASVAHAFPPLFQLRELRPSLGGDGSEGFVIPGLAESDGLSIVSAAGDLNGDELADFVVALPEAGSGAGRASGRVYVIYGRDSGFPPSLALSSLSPAGGGDGTSGFVLTGAWAFDRVGDTVSGAGDINGDGVADLIIGGAARFGSAGGAYVLYGNPAGFDAVVDLADLLPENGGDGSAGFALRGSVQDSDTGGAFVSTAGDFNNDGIDDVLLAADNFGTNTPIDQYIVYGRQSGFPAVVDLGDLAPEGGGDGSEGVVLRLPGDAYTPGAGLAGDFNGDGIDDVWMRRSGVGQVRSNGVSVVFGREGAGPVIDVELLDGNDGVTLLSPSSSTLPVASAIGDVNVDGIDDLIVGDPEQLSFRAGAGFIVYGRSSGFPPVFVLNELQESLGGDGSQGVILDGVGPQAQTGAAVGGGGDYNGDGIADVLIGAVEAIPGPGGADTGQAYVVYGSTSGLPAEFRLSDLFAANGGDGSLGSVFAGVGSRDLAGSVVTDLGDINGDAITDFAIAAPGADPLARPGAGEIYVLFGWSE